LSIDATLSPLLPREIGAAAELLASALHDDPAFRQAVADPNRRRIALIGITRIAVRDALAFGHVRAARHDQRLAGVAVWLPPGTYPMDARREARAALAMIGLTLRIPRDIRAMARLGQSLDAVFPTEPVWYLQALGILPDLQRRGIGTRLIQPVIEQAQRAGVPCYLETAEPLNIEYYRRFGFSLIEPPRPLFNGGSAIARMTTREAGASIDE